ncbi:sulfotransferase [Candidatus Woesearchaeota archaeon]|nr:sulfotransferase [Candidatus Woesearchaeota archaeon]
MTERIPKNFSPERIRLANIFPSGRASSFFFQGLFDGHPQCVTVPTMFYITDEEMKGGAVKICRTIYKRLNNIFFEPIPKRITYDAFRKPFLEYIKKYGLSKKTVFIALHYAFSRTQKQDVSKIRYIVFQGHLVSACINIFKDFPEQKVIHLVRDPRASYLSKKKSNPYVNLLFFSRLVLYGYRYFRLVDKNSLVVRHEDLHKKFSLTKKKIFTSLELKPSKKFDYSSYYGTPYTGNVARWASTTGLHLARSDSRYAHDKWKKELSNTEIKIINVLAKKYLVAYKYTQKKINSQAKAELSIKKQFNIFAQESQGIAKKTFTILSHITKIPVLGPLIGLLVLLTWLTLNTIKDELLFYVDAWKLREY